MASGVRAAAVGTNWGVVSTGDKAQISLFFGGGFERLADAYLTRAPCSGNSIQNLLVDSELIARD